MKEFTGLYQVSETLTFELKPVGKTAVMLDKSGLLQQDERRAEDYPRVKEILDERHKILLQQVLSSVDLDWEPLADAIRAFRNDKAQKKKLVDCQTDFRKKIVRFFDKNSLYEELVKERTPSKLFKRLSASGNAAKEVETFKAFACYFKGYQENRSNIYSPEAQQTSAIYRAVDENFTKFLNAVEIYAQFKVKFPDLDEEIREKAAPLLKNEELAGLLTVKAYNRFLPQSGIDLFNDIVGEINYAVNHYRQQHPEIPARELPFLPVLFKQILSDREKTFSAMGFQKDEELYLALKNFIDHTVCGDFPGKQQENLFVALQSVLESISKEKDLFVSARELGFISQKTTGRWDSFSEAMILYAEEKFKTKTRREEYCKKDIFSFSEISAWNVCSCAEEEEASPVDFTGVWHGEYAKGLFAREQELRSRIYPVLDHKGAPPLRERQKDVEVIKEYLDTVKDMVHLLKPLHVGIVNDGDLNLLGQLNSFYEHFEKIIPLYNHVRNYILRKPEDAAKIKLMFNRPTLADGWDSNKERDNLAVILRNGDSFYLGIVNPASRVDFWGKTDCTGPMWQKMNYKLLPGPNKMLPKVFFSQKNIDFFAPSKMLIKKYQAGSHKKGDNFDIKFCHELIDFFKSSLAKHEDWMKFGFKFSPTTGRRCLIRKTCPMWY